MATLTNFPSCPACPPDRQRVPTVAYIGACLDERKSDGRRKGDGVARPASRVPCRSTSPSRQESGRNPDVTPRRSPGPPVSYGARSSAVSRAGHRCWRRSVKKPPRRCGVCWRPRYGPASRPGGRRRTSCTRSGRWATATGCSARRPSGTRASSRGGDPRRTRDEVADRRTLEPRRSTRRPRVPPPVPLPASRPLPAAVRSERRTARVP